MFSSRQPPGCAEPAVAAALVHALGGRWSLRALAASGFCPTWLGDGEGRRCFIKAASGAAAEALRAEADGLRALAATGTIRVPDVLVLSELSNGCTVLALQWLDLRRPDAGFGARFGRALAALHSAPTEAGFGWARDNFLGATAQRNAPVEPAGDRPRFFNQRRLLPLRQALAARGASRELLAAVDAVMARWPALSPQPVRASLIHGDLWSGNWGMLPDGSPVIFDPAVSRSAAEAELAMMELFGGPPADFWPAYAEAAALDRAGYARRRPVYQLYHLLNHELLFGGYAQQALDVARQVLRGV